MKAIYVQAEQENRPLVWQESADPTYSPEEVLVDIHATALNRADLMQRAGGYPPPPGAPDILGLEMAGVISAVGSEVRGWSEGDRVCALLPGGDYAEQVAVPAGMLMPIPDDWTFEQAAGLPEVFLTSYVNIFMEAEFEAGETVLVHGGASGIGTSAIQLVRAAGGTVIITASTEEKISRCQRLGANLAIQYTQEDFVDRINEFTNNNGVDIILDMVGADYFSSNLSLLKLEGRLVIISTLSGGQTEIDLRSLMGRRLRLIGSVLRSRSLAEKQTITRRFREQFWDQIKSGDIQPVIDSIYPIEKANEAHEHMRQNQNIGKIILKIR